LPEGLDPYTFTVGRNYGPLKARAEQEVAKHYPGINTIVRPGLIVGPLDRSDRVSYWPVRIDRGGEVLAPGKPSDPAQILDARDLAEWMIRLAENRVYGTFTAMGPKGLWTMADLLYGVKAITSAGAQFTWVPADFLREQKISEWRNMPVWFS